MPGLDALLAELTSGDDESATAAATGIAVIGESALPALSSLLESTDADRRWWAVRALAQMSEAPLAWLIRALGDASAEVRAGAALALAAHPDTAAVPALVACLGDGDSVVSALCVNALTAIGTAAVPALLKAFAAATPRGRIQVMRTLAEIADPRAISLMLKATEENSAVLSYWAQQGLERLGLDMVYLKLE